MKTNLSVVSHGVLYVGISYTFYYSFAFVEALVVLGSSPSGQGASVEASKACPKD